MNHNKEKYKFWLAGAGLLLALIGFVIELISFKKSTNRRNRAGRGSASSHSSAKNTAKPGEGARILEEYGKSSIRDNNPSGNIDSLAKARCTKQVKRLQGLLEDTSLDAEARESLEKQLIIVESELATYGT
jgi:hypothetical protein